MPKRSFRNARPITHLALALDAAIERSGLTLLDLQEKTGINHSTLSRLRSGGQLTISPDHLAALLPALTSRPADQAALIKAHLLDHLAGPGSELIEIRITGQPKPAERPASEYELALAHLDQLARANRDFAHWIITQARMFGFPAPQLGHAKVPAPPLKSKPPRPKAKASK